VRSLISAKPSSDEARRSPDAPDVALLPGASVVLLGVLEVTGAVPPGLEEVRGWRLRVEGPGPLLHRERAQGIPARPAEGRSLGTILDEILEVA